MRRRVAPAIIAAACAWFMPAPHTWAQLDTVEAVELQRRIRDGASDPRLGQWQVELGEAHLRDLQMDLSDLEALLGVLTDDQRQRVLEHAAAAYELALESRGALAQSIAGIEAEETFGEDRDLLDLRSRLNVEFNEFRRPLLLARSSLLLATVSHDEAARELMIDAQQTLRAMEPPPGLMGAERDVLLAHAARLAGRPPGGASAQRLARAAAAMDESPRSRRLRAEALLALSIELARLDRRAEDEALVDRLRDTPPFVHDDGEPAPLWQLLLIDTKFRAALLAGDHPSRAMEIYERALTDDGLGLEAAARRSLIFARLRALEREAAFSPSQPMIALAVASETIDQAARADDVATLTRAIDLLEPLVMSGALTSAQPDAMATLLAAHKTKLNLAASMDEQILAGSRLVVCASKLAIEYPQWSQSQDALRAACELGMRLLALQESVDSEEAMQAIEDAAPDWRRAVREAIVRLPDPAERDRWRIVLAERLGPFDEESDQLLLSVADGSPHALPARLTLVESALERMRAAGESEKERRARGVLQRAALVRELLARDETSTESQLKSARLNLDELEAALALGDFALCADLMKRITMSDLDPALTPRAVGSLTILINRCRESLALALKDARGVRAGEIAIAQASIARDGLELCQRVGCPDGLVHELGLALAKGHTLAGRPQQAIPIYEDLIERRGRTATLALGLADALRESGDSRAAFALYREAVEPLELQLTYDDTFWACWAGMLEILGQENEDGSRSDIIDREIRRLSLIDPEFGGEPHRRRVEAVRRDRR